MKNNQHNLFSASGCLTPEAFERLRKGLLSVDEQQQVNKHIESCPLCSIAYEGLTEVDLSTMNSDLKEVKQKLQVIRPLDFMPEKGGLRSKIRVRIITVTTLIVLITVPFIIINRKISRPSTIINEDTVTPFRLERKDTLPARLEKKSATDEQTNGRANNGDEAAYASGNDSI